MDTIDEVLVSRINDELIKNGDKYKKTYAIESKLQTKLIDVLKKTFGEYIWFSKISDRYNRGIPDIVGCINGKFFGLELKATKGKPTLLQMYAMDKINKAGGKACIVRTVAEGLETIKSIIMT